MDCFKRIGRIGRAKRSGAHAGQMFDQMCSAARFQDIFAKTAVNMQIDESGCQNCALCVDGVGRIILGIQFLNDAVFKTDSCKGSENFAVKNTGVFNNCPGDNPPN